MPLLLVEDPGRLADLQPLMLLPLRVFQRVDIEFAAILYRRLSPHSVDQCGHKFLHRVFSGIFLLHQLFGLLNPYFEAG